MFVSGLLCFSGSVVAQPADSLKGMLLSPGPLAAAHEKLSDKCTSCHAKFSRKSQPRLCLACHKSVRADIQTKKRYHGRIEDTNCTDCHTEHKGAKADITGMDMDRFDHSLTAFPLHGQHETLACIQCHSRKRRRANALPGVWRLTRHSCSSCHDDPHKGRLKGACSQCHTEKSWHETTFDHDRTRFALEGKHRQLQCEACHKDQGFSAPVACSACHAAEDVHRGTMGSDCSKCHSSAGWHKTRFDHDTTRFALGRQHGRVPCALCHTGAPHQFDALFKGNRPVRDICTACHRQDDVHKASFGARCGSCHRGASWKEASFDHDRRTSFPLTGRHRGLACVACHTTGKVVDTAHARSACIDCHRADDVHDGSLGKSCGDCHSVSAAWSTTTFDHDFTEFPITGMHRLLSCDACHATPAFHTTRTQCEKCHQVGKVHRKVFLTQCERCHNTLDWRTWQFDHAHTRFPLEGAHRRVGCFDCHKSPRLRAQPAANLCYACHVKDDVHNGQYGSRCDNCHSQTSFKDVKRTSLR